MRDDKFRMAQMIIVTSMNKRKPCGPGKLGLGNIGRTGAAIYVEMYMSQQNNLRESYSGYYNYVQGVHLTLKALYASIKVIPHIEQVALLHWGKQLAYTSLEVDLVGLLVL